MAWQHPKRPLWLPVQDHHQRLSVLGFFRNNIAFHRIIFDQNINDDCIIAALDDFVKHRSRALKFLHIVLDNAPIHHSNEMYAAQERWEAKERGDRVFDTLLSTTQLYQNPVAAFIAKAAPRRVRKKCHTQQHKDQSKQS